MAVSGGTGKGKSVGDQKDVYLIGEQYSNKATGRKGVAVIRPAVLEGLLSEEPKVITTSPCCPDKVRHLSYADITSSLAAKQGGWAMQCKECKWHYKVVAEQTGATRLGLYGVRWISQGF
jgi:hypothetical protein